MTPSDTDKAELAWSATTLLRIAVDEELKTRAEKAELYPDSVEKCPPGLSQPSSLW
jgi:hypothetical protein